MESQLFDESTVKAECKIHNDFLNSVLGLVAFTVGLTCAGMPNTQKAAAVSLGVIIPLVIQSFFHFPPTITALRQLYNETKDNHVKEVLSYLENKYLGYKSVLTKNILYWYGFSFYLAVLFWPGLSTWLKQI